MATMNISLPDLMKSWVEAQTGTGRYSNVSDYVRDLIRREQERGARIAEMQALVDEARASGARCRLGCSKHIHRRRGPVRSGAGRPIS